MTYPGRQIEKCTNKKLRMILNEFLISIIFDFI